MAMLRLFRGSWNLSQQKPRVCNESSPSTHVGSNSPPLSYSMAGLWLDSAQIMMDHEQAITLDKQVHVHEFFNGELVIFCGLVPPSGSHSPASAMRNLLSHPFMQTLPTTLTIQTSSRQARRFIYMLLLPLVEKYIYLSCCLYIFVSGTKHLEQAYTEFVLYESVDNPSLTSIFFFFFSYFSKNQ